MRRTIDMVDTQLLKNLKKDYECKCTKTGMVFDKKHPEKKIYPTINCPLIPCGFDIESYKQYMYIWTFSICDLTIIGYTWDDFKHLLSMLKEAYALGAKVKTVKHRDKTTSEKHKAPKVLPIFIHNIKYEWAFMRKELNVSTEPFYFDKKQRNPLNVLVDESFLFIDSFKLFPMSLEEVAKAYTKTQKTHDLDFTVPRNINDAKNLSDKELDYCCNDTKILVELAKYVFDKYFIPYNKLPFTQNQMVKLIVKDSFKQELAKMTKDDKDKYVKELKRLTLSQEEYKLGRRDAFRGGACNSCFGETKDGEEIEYHDLTSAYCGSICHDYYPMSAPSKPSMPIYAMDNDIIDYYCSRFCCQMRVKFYNLRMKGDKFFKYESYHNIVPYLPNGSEPKTKEEENLANDSVLVDSANHVWKAACIMVSLLEIDWNIYKQVYAWDKVEVIDFMFETRGDLPDYVKLAALRLYGNKSLLKKAGKTDIPDYFSAKTLVSNVFGAMVQKLDDDLVNGPEKEWLQAVLDSILKPLWGVYVAAHTRRKLVNAILAIGGKYWMYNDTDSIYNVKNIKVTTKVFIDYNNRTRLKNAILCDKYGLDYNLYDDLGCWDNENRRNLSIKHFKTLGPKQYIYFYTDDKHPHGAWKIVLAGISEEYFWQAYAEKYPVCKISDKENEIKRIFDFFEKSTKISYKRNKMVFVEDTTDIINGMEVHCNTGAIIEENPINGTIGTLSEAVAMVAMTDDMDDTRS